MLCRQRITQLLWTARSGYPMAIVRSDDTRSYSPGLSSAAEVKEEARGQIPSLFSSQIMNSPFLSPNDKGVYVAICHHVGKMGYAEVTHAQIATDMNLTRKQVGSCLLKLASMRIITTVRRHGTLSRYSPNR
jgi:hypothetical protein